MILVPEELAKFVFIPREKMTDWIQLVTFHKTAAASVFRGHKREDPCMCADYYQIPTMICRGDNVIVDL